MSEPTIEIVARRLDRVERENRQLKRAGIATGVKSLVVHYPWSATTVNQRLDPKISSPRSPLDRDESKVVWSAP